MTVKPAETQPPRRLRGRRARKFWRELAPQVASAGKLTAISALLLQRLCVLLGRIADDPDDLFAGHIVEAERLAKNLGLR